jgi:hypothetical protein
MYLSLRMILHFKVSGLVKILWDCITAPYTPETLCASRSQQLLSVLEGNNVIDMSSSTGILTLILLMWRTGWTNSIPIYIQQDTLHSLFISGNCSTCFGWYFHPLSGAHTTVSTASGIYHTVTAICRYRGRAGTGLSVLWVA